VIKLFFCGVFFAVVGGCNLSRDLPFVDCVKDYYSSWYLIDESQDSQGFWTLVETSGFLLENKFVPIHKCQKGTIRIHGIGESGGVLYCWVLPDQISQMEQLIDSKLILNDSFSEGFGFRSYVIEWKFKSEIGGGFLSQSSVAQIISKMN
jgi:hypothetical protein